MCSKNRNILNIQNCKKCKNFPILSKAQNFQNFLKILVFILENEKIASNYTKNHQKHIGWNRRTHSFDLWRVDKYWPKSKLRGFCQGFWSISDTPDTQEMPKNHFLKQGSTLESISSAINLPVTLIHLKFLDIRIILDLAQTLSVATISAN
jgi:hypothetical protein